MVTLPAPAPLRVAQSDDAAAVHPAPDAVTVPVEKTTRPKIVATANGVTKSNTPTVTP